MYLHIYICSSTREHVCPPFRCCCHKPPNANIPMGGAALATLFFPLFADLYLRDNVYLYLRDVYLYLRDICLYMYIHISVSTRCIFYDLKTVRTAAHRRLPGRNNSQSIFFLSKH